VRVRAEITSGELASQALEARPSSALPVADLVGLRFSVVHLRLAGYALIAVWLNEIIAILNAPLLLAVDTRLTCLSQALDLSPLLLVGIALVAFQGGLQRSLLERLLLPLLFALLPLLAIFFLVMAPASVSNALNLNAMQEEVSRSDLRAIEQQFTRAGKALQSSKDLQELRRRLDGIPGVGVPAPVDGNIDAARREVATSLQTLRRQTQTRIGVSTTQAQDDLTRRAIRNASLAVLIAVVLLWIRAASLQVMDLSATYLAWVLVSDPEVAQSSGLKSLLEFQKACLSTSYLAMVERLIGLARRPMDKEQEERQKEMDQQLLERLSIAPSEEPPKAPWDPESVAIRSDGWRRTIGAFKGRQPRARPDDLQTEELQVEAWQPWMPAPTEEDIRRQERDLQRVRIAMARFGRSVSGMDSALYEHITGGIDRRRPRGPSPRQLRLAREALERFGNQFQEDLGVPKPLDEGVDHLGFDPADYEREPWEYELPQGPEDDLSGAPADAQELQASSRPTTMIPRYPLEEPPPPPPRRRGPLDRVLDWLITQL